MQRNKAILASLTLVAFLGAINMARAAADDSANVEQQEQAENADLQNVKVDIANGKKIFEQGKGEVPACNSCHGPEGMGDDNMGTPRLAGQGMVYLVKELEDFAHDRRTDMTMSVMNFNAKGLTPSDRVDVAAYLSTKLSIVPDKLSSLKDLAAASQPVGKPYLGKEIVLYGIPSKDVPACQSCHQFNGRGAPPIYPQIGEQKYVYLMNQLKHWRDSSRANDPLAQMRHVADKLSDEDIQNVASYLITAPFTTMGDTFIPNYHLPVAFEAH